MFFSLTRGTANTSDYCYSANTTAQICVPMPQDTNYTDKDTIDRSRVFSVYNVYRLVIGSVLFALFLSTAAEQNTAENYLNQQLMGAGLLVVSSIILAFIATRTPLDSEPGIFSVLLLDVLATTLIAHPNAILVRVLSLLVTVAAASMLLRSPTCHIGCGTGDLIDLGRHSFSPRDRY